MFTRFYFFLSVPFLTFSGMTTNGLTSGLRTRGAIAITQTAIVCGKFRFVLVKHLMNQLRKNAFIRK